MLFVYNFCYLYIICYLYIYCYLSIFCYLYIIRYLYIICFYFTCSSLSHTAGMQCVETAPDPPGLVSQGYLPGCEPALCQAGLRGMGTRQDQLQAQHSGLRMCHSVRDQTDPNPDTGRGGSSSLRPLDALQEELEPAPSSSKHSALASPLPLARGGFGALRCC